MKETAVQQQLTLLEHLDKILEFSEKEGLDEAFFGKAKEHIDAAAGELQIPPIQVVLFALVLDISVLSSRYTSDEDKLFKKIKCMHTVSNTVLNEMAIRYAAKTAALMVEIENQYFCDCIDTETK